MMTLSSWANTLTLKVCESIILHNFKSANLKALNNNIKRIFMRKLSVLNLAVFSLVTSILAPVTLANEGANVAEQAIAQKVLVSSAEQLLFYPKHNASAVANSLNHAQVPSQISAQVLSVPVTLGTKVQKGQVLVELDCQKNTIVLAHLQAQLSVAKVQYELAERQLKRTNSLHSNKNVGEAELDNSQVNVSISKLRMKEATANVNTGKLATNRCQVKAPFDGMISARFISEGDYVNIGQSLVKVVEQNNIQIEAQIPLHQLANLSKGTQYQFLTNGLSHSLVLKNIVEYIEPNSRSQIATFTLVNSQVVAGTEGTISWQSPLSYLPAHLLTQRQGEYGIFIVEDNKAQFVAVPHAQEGRPFRLSLTGNSQIIVDGRHRVKNGSLVSSLAK
jgi:RND family efflux transporter MFP subunit